MQYDWARVADTSEYVASGDYAPDNENFALARRLYSQRGKQYPVLSISIYPNVDRDRVGVVSFSIGSAFKKQSGEWWDTHYHANSNIPFELVPDLLAMIDEAKNKAAQLNAERTENNQ